MRSKYNLSQYGRLYKKPLLEILKLIILKVKCKVRKKMKTHNLLTVPYNNLSSYKDQSI